MPELDYCSSCSTHGGHSPDCPLLYAGRNGATDELTAEINEAVDYDDRKELADIWQDYAPLPVQGLTEGTYDALMHIAKWGARRALVNRADDPPERMRTGAGRAQDAAPGGSS